VAPHPNDPRSAPKASEEAMEFLITFTITVRQGTPGPTVNDAQAGEASRAQELARQGHLRRLWTLPGQGARWACGEPRTLRRCRRSWIRFR